MARRSKKRFRIKYRKMKGNTELAALYPFGRMAKGESVRGPAVDSHRISSAAYGYGRNHGMKFSCTTDNKYVRVTRVS